MRSPWGRWRTPQQIGDSDTANRQLYQVPKVLNYTPLDEWRALGILSRVEVTYE